MRRLTYADYRSFGHGPIRSAILACPLWALYGPMILIGIIMGWFLP
jgi:hypothetical protein